MRMFLLDERRYAGAMWVREMLPVCSIWTCVTSQDCLFFILRKGSSLLCLIPWSTNASTLFGHDVSHHFHSFVVVSMEESMISVRVGSFGAFFVGL